MEYMDAVLGNGAFYITVLVFSFLHECVHAFAAARAGGGGRMGLRGLFGNVLYLEPGLSPGLLFMLRGLCLMFFARRPERRPRCSSAWADAVMMCRHPCRRFLKHLCRMFITGLS